MRPRPLAGPIYGDSVPSGPVGARLAAAALAVAALGVAGCGGSGSKQAAPTGGDVGAYCAKARVLEGSTDALGDLDINDIPGVKRVMLGIQADAHAALAAAPGEIRKDVAKVVDQLDRLVAALAKVGFDSSRADAKEVEKITNAASDAQSNVADYDERTCSVTSTSEPPPPLPDQDPSLTTQPGG